MHKHCLILLIALLGTLGCAEDPPQSEYELNGFYAGTSAAPIHKKDPDALKFFNKECKKVGHTDAEGSQYECWFSK